MTLRRPSCLSVLLLGAALSSCAIDNGACTELGCEYETGAFLRFDRTEDHWAAEQGATYTISIAWDGVDHVCVEPLSSEGGSCDSEEMQVSGFSSGSAGILGLEGVLLSVFPGPTHVTILRDDSVVFEDDLDIEASEDRPNGEGCEPLCRYWDGEISW